MEWTYIVEFSAEVTGIGRGFAQGSTGLQYPI